MRSVLVLFTSLALFFGFGGSPAQAQDSCEITVYGGASSSYGFGDIAETIHDGPVAQVGATRTCGRFSIDVFTTTALTTNGQYGNRGGGDEIDFTVSWADSVNSPVGALDIEVSAAYWVISDFGNTSDDFVALTIRVGRPIALGSSTTLMPYVQGDRWMEFGGYRTNLLRAGAVLSHEFNEQWSVEIDGAYVDESFDGTRTWRGDFSVTRTFENGWDLTLSASSANSNYGRMDPVVGLSVSRTF